MTPRALAWTPAMFMGLGYVLTIGIGAQQALPLRMPLRAAVPLTVEGFKGQDLTLSEREVEVVGVTDYLMRRYSRVEADDSTWFTTYIGFYDRQSRGKTIHSPKNCLPGGGWEPLASQVDTIETASGSVRVNRYLLHDGTTTVLVLYWYQGRGRVQASEYAVKWDLLRDAATRRRSDEALVRIVVPVDGTEAAAASLARDVAAILVPALYEALPQ